MTMTCQPMQRGAASALGACCGYTSALETGRPMVGHVALDHGMRVQSLPGLYDAVAKWLGAGLQNQPRQFDPDRRLGV